MILPRSPGARSPGAGIIPLPPARACIVSPGREPSSLRVETGTIRWRPAWMRSEESRLNSIRAATLVRYRLAMAPSVSPRTISWRIQPSGCCRQAEASASFVLNRWTVWRGSSSRCGPSGPVAQRLNPGLSMWSSSRVMPARSAAVRRSIWPSSSTCRKGMRSGIGARTTPYRPGSATMAAMPSRRARWARVSPGSFRDQTSAGFPRARFRSTSRLMLPSPQL